MAIYVVNHSVEDFTAWKRAYEAFKPTAMAAGITDEHVLQSPDDPNHVVVIGNGEIGDLQAFLQSDALKSAMAGAGVVGIPDIYVGEDA